MGVYLSAPRTDKKTSSGSHGRLTYASSEMQGWRMSMEDAQISEPKLDDNTAVFGVFDGHGGEEVSIFVSRHLCEELKRNEAYRQGNFEKALQEVFLRMDDLLLKPTGQQELIRIKQNLPDDYRVEETDANSSAGCTSVVALVRDNTIWVANAGDSRCILARAGKAIPMSIDHKPEMPEEFARIQNANGYVENGRVMGNINLSRSIGDFEYKKGELPPSQFMVTAFPEVKHEELTPDTDFMVLACDGIWDMVSNQECADFVYERLNQNMELNQIVEALLDRCLAPEISAHGGLGCDNMTCIIVKFNH